MNVASVSDTASRAEPSSFVDALALRLEENPPKRKGERTRERIKLATARMLERLGYHAMRVLDITQEAGVADGSFYVYFKDKSEAALAVLSEFVEFIPPGATVGNTSRSAFDTIRETNCRFIRLSRANAGLMRCMLQVVDEHPDYSALVQDVNLNWYTRVSRSVIRHYPEGAVDEDSMLLVAYALGSMMDEIVRRLVIYPDQNLIRLTDKIVPTDKALADALSVLWFRTLYPASEIPKGLRGAAAKIAQLSNETAMT
ncbi:TetR/AcrR family transcriptional regulator [Henriciella sp. AS95]|uniref:TetR/AcrR family transcriptional regulator n=1 Tax=Henriciella sp. AS95 TaxID=3135782 RepID=UPI00316D0D0D